MKGKGFQSRKAQGGWVAIAAMVVGGIASSAGQQSSQNRQNKQNYADQRDLANLQFQQQEWLNQQSRAWNLEDYQRTQNYKENAIGGFRDAAPANAANATGDWGAPPAPTHVDTSGLAQTQANGQPLIYDPRTGQPMMGNAPLPAKNTPLSQFG